MAKKKNQDQDPDEDKRDQFDDDEDFGLPDLEYDELDNGDEDFEDEMDAPEPDTSKTAEKPVPKAAEESDEISLESEGDVDDIVVSDEDLQRELDEMEKEGELGVNEESGEEIGLNLGEESGDVFDSPAPEKAPVQEFYEEESFDEFKEDNSSIFGAAEKSTPSPSSMKSGLSTSEKKLFDKSVPDALTQKSNKGKFTKIVILGTVLFTVVAVVLAVMYGDILTIKEPVKVEKKVPPPPPVTIEEPKEEKEVPKDTRSKVNPGQISVLESKTSKSYVIVASFFDGDLAQDHANALAAKGKSPYVIAPFGKSRFYRVAIAEYGSFADAQKNLESFKGEYGNEIWALRY